jgi:hypothetical protein
MSPKWNCSWKWPKAPHHCCGKCTCLKLQKGKNPEDSINIWNIFFLGLFFLFSKEFIFNFTKPRHFAQKAATNGLVC